MNNFPHDSSQTSFVVTLYVVHDCPLCADARRELTRRGVAFVERDVADDFGALRRMYKLTKQRFVPVIELNDFALVRPTSAELDELLSQP